MQRPLEAIYIRFIIDEIYAKNICNDLGFAKSLGLTSSERNSFINLPADAVKTERSARVAALWERLNSQAPWTLYLINNHLESADLSRLKTEFFGSVFWEFNKTIEIYPYQSGFELVSPLKRIISKRLKVYETRNHLLWRDMIDLEWNYFRCLYGAGLEARRAQPSEIFFQGESTFNLFKSINHSEFREDHLRLSLKLRWAIANNGSVGKINNSSSLS